MRKKIIAGNWKMNNTVAQSQELLNSISQLAECKKAVVVVCPPFTALAGAANFVKGSLCLGAQNVHWQTSGAFTGEISATQLVELGVKYCLVGHSERRQYFNETDETVNKRLLAACQHGITPILCVGESLEQRQSEQTEAVLQQQLKGALAGVDAAKVVVAYEPIWAIGTGVSASAEQAQQACGFIRKVLSGYGGQDCSILYGGSMNGENAAGFLAMPDIDGGLIGGASLKAAEFVKIVDSIR